MKQFYFLSGLPRSGSTLLSAILNQNPQIYASANSPLLDFLYYNEQYWLESEQGKANPLSQSFTDILTNLPFNFYQSINKPIVIDKSRAWPNNIDRIQKVFGYDQPKILCPVRNINDILESFLSLLNKQKNHNNFVDQELIKKQKPINDHTRVEYLLSDVGIVNQSLWALQQAYIKNQQHCCLIIEYDHLVQDPKLVMQQIYEFLNIESIDHDFDNLKNITPENDQVYGLEGMHQVHKKLKYYRKKTTKLLYTPTYEICEFWRKPMPQANVFSIDIPNAGKTEIIADKQPLPPKNDLQPNSHQQILIQPNFLSPDLIDFLVKHGQTNIGPDLSVFDPDASNSSKETQFELDKNTRNTQIVGTTNIEDTMKQILTAAVRNFIEPFFKVKIYSSEQIQFLHYGIGGFYKPHCDGEALWNNNGQLEWRRNIDRDISMVVFLNNEFEGGNLIFPNQKIVVMPEPGMLVCFPSTHNWMHAVTPITAGQRFSMVAWMDIVR